MAGKLSTFFGAQDMTQGKPLSCLIQFAIPLLIGNIAQQMYNTVDSIVVGQYIGDQALAAVGAGGPILNLFLVLFMGISTGAGIMVSQYFGARQRESLSKTVGTTITLSLLSSLLIMVLGPIITPPFMTALDTPSDIYDMSCSYLTIIFLGIMGLTFYNILSGVLRGLGDSFMPLVYLVIACILNIVLDILFVAQFKMGVPGVAWATVIAQFVSAVLCLIRLARMKEILTLNFKMLKPESAFCWRLVKLGLPSGLAQAIFSMAAIVVQSLTNSFGTSVIACSIVVMRVDGFAMMPNFTFGMAMTTFSGQNVGAGKIHRVEEGTREGMKAGIITSAFLTMMLLFFGVYLMRMFTDTPDVVTLGVHMMRILAVGYIAMAVTQILSGVMRGAGDTVTPMWISFLTTVVIRVPLAYGIAYFTRSEELPVGSPDSLYISLLISWIIGAVVTYLCYHFGKWKKKAQMFEKNAGENLSEEKSPDMAAVLPESSEL